MFYDTRLFAASVLRRDPSDSTAVQIQDTPSEVIGEGESGKGGGGSQGDLNVEKRQG